MTLLPYDIISNVLLFIRINKGNYISTYIISAFLNYFSKSKLTCTMFKWLISSERTLVPVVLFKPPVFPSKIDSSQHERDREESHTRQRQYPTATNIRQLYRWTATAFTKGDLLDGIREGTIWAGLSRLFKALLLSQLPGIPYFNLQQKLMGPTL